MPTRFVIAPSGKIQMKHEYLGNGKNKNSWTLPYHVQKKYWDKSKGRLKENTRNKERDEEHRNINDILTAKERQLTKIEQILYESVRVSKQNIRDAYDEGVGLERDVPYFRDELEMWIKNEAEINAYQRMLDKDYEPHIYWGERTGLLKFLKKGIKDKAIEDIDTIYVRMIQEELKTTPRILYCPKKKHSLMYSKSTQIAYFGAFKRFLDECYVKYKIDKNSRMFYAPKIKAPVLQHVAFTNDEVDLLWNAKLEGKEDYHRDLLLILCYTGARYSDGYKMDSNNISSDMELNYVVKKTGIVVKWKISVDDRIFTLLNRITSKKKKHYKHNCTMKHNQDVFDKSLPSLCRKVGITSEVKVSQHGDNLIPKCDLVGTHTGRRTFIYHNIKDNGMRYDTAREIVGHHSILMTERYVKNTIR